MEWMLRWGVLNICASHGGRSRLEQHRIVQWIGCENVRVLIGLPQQTAFTGVEIGGGIAGTVGALFAGVPGLSAAAVIALAGVVVGVIVTVWCVAQWDWCKTSIGDIAEAAQAWLASTHVARFVIDRLPKPNANDQDKVRWNIDQHIRTKFVSDVKSSSNPLQLMHMSASRLERTKANVKSQAPKLSPVTPAKNGKSAPPPQGSSSERRDKQPQTNNVGGRYVDDKHTTCFKEVKGDLYDVSSQRVKRIADLKKEMDLLLEYVQEIMNADSQKLSASEKLLLQKKLNEWRKEVQLAECLAVFNDKYLPGQNAEHMFSKIRKDILDGRYGAKVRALLDRDVKARKVRVARDFVPQSGRQGRERYVRART